MSTVFVAVIVYCMRTGDSGINCISTLGRSTPFKTEKECVQVMSEQLNTPVSCQPVKINDVLPRKEEVKV